MNTNTNKKLMVYPFNKSVSAIARYARLLKGYELVAAVSPKSYGYEGKDISNIDGGNPVGITVVSSFAEGLKQCDCILFSASIFPMDLNYYVEKIGEAAVAGKEILITKALAENFRNEERNLPPGSKVLGCNKIEKKLSYEKTMSIREISIPVITAFGIGKFCNGLDTQLLLAEKFEREGYRVCKVTSSDLGELFGMDMLPDFVYEEGISYEDKTVNFNYFLYSMVNEKQPHVLILEIAEAIMPYNSKITNHFGVTPGIVTRTVQTDIGILNLYYSNYDKDYLDYLKSFCRYALDTEISYIGIANTVLEIQEFNSAVPVQYVPVDREAVFHAIDNEYKEYESCMFFNIYDPKRIDAMYSDIVDKLSQNKETVRA